MSNRNFTIHTGERTASSATKAIKATSETIALAFDVTVVDGTSATLNISVEWSPNGTNFGPAATPDTLPEITATGVYQKRFDIKAKYYRVVFTVGGDVQEVQAITHDHTDGTFTVSFDSEGPSEDLDWDAPEVAISAEGALTIAAKPVAAVAAQGELTIDVKPIDGDDLLIDEETYTFQDTLTDVAGNVAIGATLATAQANLVAAINRELGYGTKYANSTDQHPTVSIADFDTDAAILTARTAGSASDAIVTTETFDAATNVFDETTLGGETTGIDGDSLTIDLTVYTYVDALTGAENELLIGATLATAQAALVTALATHATVAIAAFDTNVAVLTAVELGADGNAIATTETFASGSNVFDAATLGTETLGVWGVLDELEKFANIGQGSLEVTRNGAGDWDVTFPSTDGDVELITIDGTNLTGGSTADVAQTTQGVNATVTFQGVATHFDSNR